MASGIYCIRNTTNNHWYVGQSQSISCRWASHRRELRRGSHVNAKLQAAWIKYGPDAFGFEVLVLAPVGLLDDLEQAYLDDPATSHYNIAKDAAVSGRGLTRSAEHRAKVGAANRGRRASDETRSKISAAGRGRLVSDDTRARMRAVRQSRPHSAENRAKMSAANKGRPKSAETRAQISASKMGRQKPGKQRNNTSGFRGVYWEKTRGKWKAQATLNRKNLHLGMFSSKEDAARAYDRKAREIHGPSAILNFPGEDSH